MIWRHTPQILDPQSKRDQQPDYCRNVFRSRKPDYLVAVGICTHTRYLPTIRPDVERADLGPGWQGGYYCPCHGSRFDLMERVYKDIPVPLYVAIPPYYHNNDAVVTVGLDAVGTSPR